MDWKLRTCNKKWWSCFTLGDNCLSKMVQMLEDRFHGRARCNLHSFCCCCLFTVYPIGCHFTCHDAGFIWKVSSEAEKKCRRKTKLIVTIFLSVLFWCKMRIKGKNELCIHIKNVNWQTLHIVHYSHASDCHQCSSPIEFQNDHQKIN